MAGHRARRALAVLIPVLSGSLVLVAGPPAARAATVAPAPYLVPVDGGPLADVVVGADGHAYATNPGRNEVEVLSLTTKTLEAPIAVGPQPQGLDFSADGTKLYVANSGDHYVSEVDLAQRREVRRIAVPAGTADERPFDMAVANDGTALLTTSFPGFGSTSLYRMDLASGTLQSLNAGATRPRTQASGDRSRIAVVSTETSAGTVQIYTPATGTLGPRADLQGVKSLVALDKTGSKILVNPGTTVLGPDLRVQATIPSGGAALAVNGAGSTAYRLQDSTIDVLDLKTNLVSASISLPDPGSASPGTVALSTDESTLVAGTSHGLSVVPVSAAVPVPPCTPGGSATAITFCGAPLADVVVDAGHAYASNPARNEVEVVSLATGTVETPILVGSQPSGLDFSPDGKLLYVADSGANDISVIDLAQRREVRRISVPSGNGFGDFPLDIAVARNGTALVTTTFAGSGYGARMLQIDLAQGTVRFRTDFGNGGITVKDTRMRANADRSLIAIVPDSSDGQAYLYDAAFDTFTPGKRIGEPGRFVAIGGSTILVSGYVLDRDLTLRATLTPSVVNGVALNGSGTVGYLVRQTSVDVINPSRGLVTATIPLPPHAGTAAGAVALTPDNSTLAVLTDVGLAIVRTSAAAAVPSCSTPFAPADVVAICGPLAEAVVDQQGHLYASNPSRNEVEVVSLATKTIEGAIPVGSQPRGLDLSVDGTTLYVANSGGEDVSVVDVAQRREVRRITMPPSGYVTRPYSVAMAENGQVLVTTTQPGTTNVLQIDSVSGAVTVGLGGELIGDQGRLEASGDRSRVVILEPGTGHVEAYDALTGAVSASGAYPGTFAAVDATGSTVVTSTNVLDRNLAVLGSLGPGSGDVAVNSTGTIGYRLGNGVEVLDLARRVVERVIPFPAGVDAVTRVVLAPDDSTLAVLSSKGIWITSLTYPTPMTPVTVWSQPGNPSLDGTGGWIATTNDPVAGPGQLPAKYLYAQYFSFLNGGAVGAIGLVTDPTGKFAMVNVVEPNGTAHTAVIPYQWTGNRIYYPYFSQIGPDKWGAWIYDLTANSWTPIGVLTLPATWGKLSPGRLTAMVWFGPTAADCADYPRADVYFYPPDGYKAGAHAGSVSSSTGASPASGCPVTSSVESGWSRYRAGA